MRRASSPPVTAPSNACRDERHSHRALKRRKDGYLHASKRVDVGISVAVGAVVIGISIGLVGVGGIFLIPLLVFAGFGLEDAIGISLVAFTVSGIIATAIYWRRSAIDWRSAALTSAGSVVGGPLGAKLSLWLPVLAVSGCFAAFLLVTGITTLLRSGTSKLKSTQSPHVSSPVLVGCGLVVGVASGLAGVGGPAVLVPLLLLFRFPAGAAVAISQPNAIAASGAGAVGHVLFGRIDVGTAAFLSVLVGAGTAFGAIIHERVARQSLRTIVGLACLLLGLWLSGELVRKLQGS